MNKLKAIASNSRENFTVWRRPSFTYIITQDKQEAKFLGPTIRSLTIIQSNKHLQENTEGPEMSNCSIYWNNCDVCMPCARDDRRFIHLS